MPKKGFPKICNYCKNHPIAGEMPVLEKLHRPCEKYNNKEHFKICKPCERNHRKTENVRIWRAKKANKKPSDIAIDKIIAELLKDEVNYEIANSKNVDQNSSDEMFEIITDDFIMAEDSGSIKNEWKQSTELPNQDCNDSGFTLVIQHPLFPNVLLNENDAMRFQSQIEDMIDDLRENEKTPKFISHVIENGCWRVVSADESTQKWFNEKASAFTCLVDNTNVPVRVIPLNELPRFICAGYIPGKAIESAKILSRIQKQNSGVDTSRWYIREIEQQEKQFLISFMIDPLSLNKIQENNCVLNFGMNQVNLFICEQVNEKFEEPEEQIVVC
ncbi:hypothetical protein ACKWTF_013769 [Chironomus riparius]